MAYNTGDMLECTRAKGTWLTQGKYYKVFAPRGEYEVFVTNDRGEITRYANVRFESVDEQLAKPIPARLRSREG